MKRISGNPQIAYNQGYKNGYEEGVPHGFNFAGWMFLVALYNVSDGLVAQTKQPKLAQAIEDEMNRLFNQEIMLDLDKAEVVKAHAAEIRKKWGMK